MTNESTQRMSALDLALRNSAAVGMVKFLLPSIGQAAEELLASLPADAPLTVRLNAERIVTETQAAMLEIAKALGEIGAGPSGRA
jgi:hypothetical protein